MKYLIIFTGALAAVMLVLTALRAVSGSKDKDAVKPPITVKRSWKTLLLGTVIVLLGLLMFIMVKAYPERSKAALVIVMIAGSILTLAGAYLFIEGFFFRLTLFEDCSIEVQSLGKLRRYEERILHWAVSSPQKNEKRVLTFTTSDGRRVAAVDEDARHFREVTEKLRALRTDRRDAYLASHLNVALLQLTPSENMDENLGKGLDAVRQAGEAGADIVLFPEMWSTGYGLNTPPEEWHHSALSKDSRFVTAFRDLARELSVAVGITFLERAPEGILNSMILFDRNGADVLHYSKVHTCDFGDERVLARGKELPVADLETAKGVFKVGAMICYDREFPETARILMLKGAELILVPNACPMEVNRISQLRGRAYENMVAIATCNYPETVPDCNGHSTAFDGVAYKEGTEGSRDTKILEADAEPGIYLACFDMESVRDYRAREVHGNAYRRPELYGPIIEKEIREPFIRPDRKP